MLAGGAAVAEPRFELLGPGTIAAGISADGRTVAGQFLFDDQQGGQYIPFIWDVQGGRRDLDIEQVPLNQRVYGISGDGSTITGFRKVTLAPPGLTRGYVYNHRTGQRTDVTGEPDSPGSYPNAMLRAVSHDGSIAVGNVYADIQAASKPIVWSEEGGRRQMDLGRWVFGDARGVTADGSIAVGEVYDFGTTRAAVWTTLNGQLTLLPGLPGGSGSAVAYAVSADGSTVVGVASREMVVWRHGQITALGRLGGLRVTGNAVNADGRVICGYTDGADGAAIWTEATGLVRFSDYLRQMGMVLPEGLIISRVTGISADGTTFSAWGWSSARGEEGIVISIPAPATLVVLSAGLAGVRRRR
jgi:uncharacterized membrane protein